MDNTGSFLERCIESYSSSIAVAVTLAAFVIIGLLTLTLSRKWAWGLLGLPLVYLGAKTAADLFVVMFFIVGLGLPLLTCL